MPGIAPLREEREARGNPQDNREEVRQLLRKREQQRLVRDFFHLVRAELIKPPRCLGVAQPGEAALQAGKGIGDREVVNLQRWLAF